MFTVAALLKSGGHALADEDKFFEITLNGGKKIRVPKDGVTDNWRLQEAVEAKTCGGKGLVTIPDLVQEDIKPVDYWTIKKAWDKSLTGEPTISNKIWGGAFESRAMDYDDDEEYQKLDLDKAPYYYNILMTTREKRDFEKVNPRLFYQPCEGKCLPKKHYHAVRGLFKGACLGGTLDRQCPPPLTLLDSWNYLADFDPAVAGEGDAPAKPKVPSATSTGPTTDAESSRPQTTTAPTSGMAGSNILRGLIEGTTPSWMEIEEMYRTPAAAKWASTETFASSGAGQRKLKQKWNAAFTEKIMPLVQGEGTPVVDVLRKAWDIDQDARKVLANYFVRRLTSGDSGICETEYGNLVLQTE